MSQSTITSSESIDDHAEWVSRFEGALRALPETQRQRSVLALLNVFRVPERLLRGATAPTEVFRSAVRTAEVGATGTSRTSTMA